MSIIELLELLDGYGIIFTDDDLVQERLEDLGLDKFVIPEDDPELTP